MREAVLAIETIGLTRHFANVRAVEGLSLQVPRGSVYAFLGPNGAGKTTTIRMLLGLTRPSFGKISVLGEPFNRSTRLGVLRQIGAMVEAPSLYPHLSGCENLRVTQELLSVDQSRIMQVLEIVRLENEAHRLVNTYSQGMRQRLGIALALLAEPDILILDEPTNGLDPAGMLEMRELIRGLPAERGVTIFLSSHLLGEVEQVATHVGIIGQGHLLFQGTLSSLQSCRRTRVVFEVDQPSVADELLRKAGWIVDCVNELSLTVRLTERVAVARATAVLITSGVSVYQVRTERRSLEDLFLDLTKGASLGAASDTKE